MMSIRMRWDVSRAARADGELGMEVRKETPVLVFSGVGAPW